MASCGPGPRQRAKLRVFRDSRSSGKRPVADLPDERVTLHKEKINEKSGERLATAISALIARFKIGQAGSAYDGLSLTDAAVISCLADAAAAGRAPIQKEVGEALGLPKTTMTSAVKRLSTRGLVEQGSGARDARARTLRLTAPGQQLGSTLKEAQIRASMAILHSLPVRDRDRLVELLETVVAAVPDETTTQQK